MSEAGDQLRDRWFEAFETALQERFPDHFDAAEWVYRLERAGPSLTAGDRFAPPSVTVDLPPAHFELNAWSLADELLGRLRAMAEGFGFLEPRP